MAVAGICLGVAAMVSIDVVNRSVLRSFEDSFNHVTGRATLQITGAAVRLSRGACSNRCRTWPASNTPCR